MRRGVGYCENTACDDFTKGVFLLNHGNLFYCPRCREMGHIVPEKAHDNDEYDGVYKTVTVEYGYDPIEKRYRDRAIVDITELPCGGSYTLSTPLVKTEQRALKIAESIINMLNIGWKERMDASKELVLSWDLERDEFKRKCEEIGALLEEKERRLRNVVQSR